LSVSSRALPPAADHRNSPLSITAGSAGQRKKLGVIESGEFQVIATTFAGALLNFVYMMTSSAGVNTFYALLGVMLVLAWRNVGMVGLDSFVIRSTATLSPIGSFVHSFIGSLAGSPLVGATTD